MKRILLMLLTSLLMFSCDPEELIVELNVTTSSTDVSIFGGNDGSITVIVKSGNGGYLYSLKSTSDKIDNKLFTNLSSDNKTSYVFSNLPSDNYQITVTDNGDKKFTHSIIINEPNPDDLSVSFDYTVERNITKSTTKYILLNFLLCNGHRIAP
ncbi:MAG: SprB repeat-containing protein [Saccharofermentanales bacterium]